MNMVFAASCFFPAFVNVNVGAVIHRTGTVALDRAIHASSAQPPCPTWKAASSPQASSPTTNKAPDGGLQTMIPNSPLPARQVRMDRSRHPRGSCKTPRKKVTTTIVLVEDKPQTALTVSCSRCSLNGPKSYPYRMAPESQRTPTRLRTHRGRT